MSEYGYYRPDSLNASRLMALSFLILAACNGNEDTPLATELQQEYFTQAVETVAQDGGEPFALDSRISCDFELLAGDLTIRRVLADETDYKAAVVEDTNGNVPEFGLIQCFDDGGDVIIKGNDGY